MAQAKVINRNGEQIIILPPEIRFESNLITIKKTPQGILLVEDTQQYWDAWFAELDAIGSWDVSLEDLAD